MLKLQVLSSFIWNTQTKIHLGITILIISIIVYNINNCGPGSVVGIATAYVLDGPGIVSRWGEIFRTGLDWPWGPRSLLYNAKRVFPGVKMLPGRDADPSPPSIAEV